MQEGEEQDQVEVTIPREVVIRQDLLQVLEEEEQVEMGLIRQVILRRLHRELEEEEAGLPRPLREEVVTPLQDILGEVPLVHRREEEAGEEEERPPSLHFHAPRPITEPSNEG